MKVVGGNNGETFDDFLRFINDQPIDIGEDSQGHSIKPLNWWCYYEQCRYYLRLLRMAINIFSITPILDKPEKVFSGTRHMVSWDRT